MTAEQQRIRELEKQIRRLLGVAVIVVTGIPLILADKFIGGGNGTARIAAAGAAVANPVIIAQINPVFEPVAASATALFATSVIV